MAPMKYNKGNTKVMVDLGPLYKDVSALAIKVDMPISTLTKLIIRDFLKRGQQDLVVPTAAVES